MNPEDVVADFRKKYEGCFVYVQEPNSQEQNLFYVEKVEADPVKVGVLHLLSEEIGRIRLNFGSAHTLNFVPVPVGVFQFDAKALYCRRKPVRQWRKGICSDNTQISATTDNVASSGNMINYRSVLASFTRQTFSLKEAIGKLKSETCQSVALANNLSISQPFTKDVNYVLFFWNTAIAKISPDGKLVLMLEQVFEALVKQFLNEEEV